MTERIDDIEVLTRLRTELEQAENAGDAETIARLMADDAVVMVPSFAVRDGHEASSSFIRDILCGLHEAFVRVVTYTSAEIAVHGDVAFDRGTFAFTTEPREGGPTSRATGKYLWLYSRDGDGEWRLARLIASLDEEESSPAAHPYGNC
jgi:uncharacterized protein (TIGR02246 family)